jgi:hypothetical protein
MDKTAQPTAKLFEINTFFHAFELPSFDLNNPGALAASFGESHGDSESESTSSGFELDDSIMEPFRVDLAREEYEINPSLVFASKSLKFAEKLKSWKIRLSSRQHLFWKMHA